MAKKERGVTKSMENMWADAMAMAIELAARYDGATSPNPPVGAAILDEHLNIISVGAHERAGGPHAEINALKAVPLGAKPHTLIVSLEPCNHSGRTPPCTEAILRSGIRRVVVGALDPNPHVKGGGVDFLRKQGIEVITPFMHQECVHLMEGFWFRCLRRKPMLIVKTAWTTDGSMIPPVGSKTFTSESSLRFAHELRRSADAIVTGSGTVIADQPLFTVRHVQDHPNKERDLIVLDRRGRVGEEWVSRQKSLWFKLLRLESLEKLVEYLSQRDYLKVLLEAGPQLSQSILESDLWDLHIKIIQGNPDRIEKIYREEPKILL